MERAPSDPATVGPYAIVDRLASGGMGVVYRARHGRTGEIVALKTVRLASERHLQGIRREIRALSRIRHPGIVRVVDHGVEAGAPWYAMELLDALTLSAHAAKIGVFDHLEDSQPGPGQEPTLVRGALTIGPEWSSDNLAEAAPRAQMPAPVRRIRRPAAGGRLRDALDLVRQTCIPLAFLHGAGIVHRDLKPANVLVKADGLPVLVDFGIAARAITGRDALEVGGKVVGTAAFMAPEQVQGELVDARADLYAIGCILYELVVGERPFVGNPSQVMYLHVHRAPTRPSELVDDVPAALEEIILRLLAKNPRDRLGHADDVAAALGAVADEIAPDVPFVPMEGPRPQPWLYRPGLAGRDPALAELVNRLDRLSEHAGVVLVGGASGIGKTRLLIEVAAEATRSDVTVVAAQCVAGGSALHAWRPFLQAVADRCREEGAAEAHRLLGEHGPVLAMYEPSLEGLGPVGPVPDLPPDAARLRLFRAVAAALRAFARGGPLLVVLDDVHVADRLSLDLLAWIDRAGLERAVLIAATYRSEEVGPRLAALAAEAETLHLGRLDEPAVGAMIADMLAVQAPPHALVRFVAEQSEGNPFFVAEYLRSAVQADLLRRDARGRWQVADIDAFEAGVERLPVPKSLKSLVRERLQQLSPAAQAVAEAAAVVGREFPVPLVQAMVGQPEEAVLDALEELVRRQVIEDADGERLRFAHDRLRQGAYERIPEAERRHLHRAAAEHFERLYPDRRDELLAELARQWEEAGEAERAWPLYLEAARRALGQYAHAEAERLYRAGIALAPVPTPETVTARGELANFVIEPQGRLDEAFAEQRTAIDEGRAHGHRSAEARAVLGLGRLHQVNGRAADARRWQEEALRLARACGDRLIEGRALNNLALLARDRGDLAEARLLFEQDLAIVRALGDRAGEGVTLGNLSIVAHDEQRYDEAIALQEASLAIAREVGDRGDEGTSLSNRAEIDVELGRPRDATTHWEQSILAYREMGQRFGEALALVGLGSLARREGDLARAARLLDEAAAMLRELGKDVWLAGCLAAKGHVRLARGESPATELAEARRLAATAGAASETARAIARLERAIEARDRGEALWHGERREDVSDALLAALDG